MVYINVMNLSGFDLNLLKVLDALLREGTTVAAGERIGLSQPAVSAALGRLRAALNDELFVRRGQRLVPTPFAQSLETPLRDHFDQLQSMLSGGRRFDPTFEARDFRLSGADFFSELVIPKLAADLQREAPRMRIQLVDLVPDNYLDTLERYKVDMGFIPKMRFEPWVGYRHVFNASFVVIAGKNHSRLTRAGVKPGDVIPLDLFCDLGHVLMSPEGKFRALTDDALEKIGRSRRVVMTMPFFAGVYRAVEGSDLIALIPQQLAHTMSYTRGVDIYRAPIPIQTAQLYMIWHRRFHQDPAHKWLRHKIADMLLPLNESEPPLGPDARDCP